MSTSTCHKVFPLAFCIQLSASHSSLNKPATDTFLANDTPVVQSISKQITDLKFESILAFGIFYALRKGGFKWNAESRTGSKLLAKIDSEVEFGEYELPFRQSRQTGPESDVSSGDFLNPSRPASPVPNRAAQETASQTAVSSATPVEIGNGTVLLERPYGQFKFVVFYLLREKLEEYEKRFPGRYANIDVSYIVREGESVLFNMVNRLMDRNDLEHEGVVDLLLLVGAFAVQCVQQKEQLDLIDFILQKACNLYSENEKWELVDRRWVPFCICLHIFG